MASHHQCRYVLIICCTPCFFSGFTSDHTLSFDRRRRRRSAGDGNQTDEVVFQEIRIEDKFKFEAQQGEPGHEINFSGSSSGTSTSTTSTGDQNTLYWNTYTFALVLVAFVVIQLFVIFACWLCATYKSRGNREAASIYESAVSEYASTVRTPISWDNSYYKWFSGDFNHRFSYTTLYNLLFTYCVYLHWDCYWPKTYSNIVGYVILLLYIDVN